MSISFRCECGKILQVNDKLAGRKGKCPSCGKIMVIPTESQQILEEKPPAPESGQPGTAPQAPGAETAAQGVVCPNCGHAVEPGAVMCTECGTNLGTGAKFTAPAAEYDPTKLILPAVIRPMEAVGTIIDTPLTAKGFQRVLAMFIVGAIGTTLLWSLNFTPGYALSIVPWYYFVVLAVTSILLVLIDGTVANFAGQQFGNTSTSLAHVVIAILVLNGVWGIGNLVLFGVYLATPEFAEVVVGYMPWFMLVWAIYMTWALLARAYDTTPTVGIIFAVGSGAVKGLLLAFLRWLLRG